MNEKIKTFVKNRPYLMKIYNKVRSGSTFKPSYTKTVQGSGNRLHFHNSTVFIECSVWIKGNNNEITIEDSCLLTKVAMHIFGNNNKIYIGKAVEFDEGGSLWIEDEHCEISIGQETSFVNTDIAVTESGSKVTIGKNCLFAYDVDVRTGDSHSIIDMATNKRTNYAKSITIGNHVWVASHVSILKGVTIPDNTIVATRSLVTKSFEQEYTVIGGNPAAVRKEGVRWTKERIYDK